MTFNSEKGAVLSERVSRIVEESRSFFLRRLSGIARRAGLFSQPAMAAFIKVLGDSYDELVMSRRDGFEQTHGLTASHITLMDESDLELKIKTDEIGRHLADTGGALLWRVLLRYMTLLDRPAMTPADNPVGMETIAAGLLAICRSSDSSHDDNLSLLAALEEQLLLELPDLYEELNELLAGNKVEAANAPTVTSRTTGVPGMTGTVDTRGNPLSDLQSLLSRQRSGGLPGGGVGAEVASQRSVSSGDVAQSAANLVALNQLAARIDQIGIYAPSHGVSDEAREGVEKGATRVVSARDLGLPPGSPEAVALDTLSLIFEDILSNGELPVVVAGAIARLQIPLLKLAIFDQTLFSDAGHPARRLINGIARAAVGLPRDAGRGHMVCARLSILADKVCETFRRDVSALAVPLAELETMIAERDSAVSAAAHPYKIMWRGRETGDRCVTSARKWLQDVVGESGLAPEIVDFLSRYWVRVMETACREGGEAGEQWRNCCETINDLCWSVQPKTQPEERKQLVRLVPGLLKRINAGFDRIGVAAEDRTCFLDDCFMLQSGALRGEPASQEEAGTVAASTQVSRMIVDQFEVDGQCLKSVALAATPRDVGAGASETVHSDDWLQFAMPGGESLCGYVCGQNRHSGSILLFNPDWGYAVTLAAPLLAQQLHDAEAKVVSSRAIFDIAAQRVIKRLAGS